MPVSGQTAAARRGEGLWLCGQPSELKVAVEGVRCGGRRKGCGLTDWLAGGKPKKLPGQGWGPRKTPFCGGCREWLANEQFAWLGPAANAPAKAKERALRVGKRRCAVSAGFADQPKKVLPGLGKPLLTPS